MIGGFDSRTRQLHAAPPASLIFSQRLKQAREMRGLSQRQLGHLLGLSKATGGVRINRYEQQASKSDIQTAANLAVLLKVPLAYLFADTSEMADYILAFAPG